MLNQTFLMECITLQSLLKPLWQPSAELVNSSNMTRFMRSVETELDLQFNDYDELHRWSVEHPEQFWLALGPPTNCQLARL